MFEALVGALYLGKGLTYAHKCFRRWMAGPETQHINFFTWESWRAHAADIEPLNRVALMPEDDKHKPRRSSSPPPPPPDQTRPDQTRRLKYLLAQDLDAQQPLPTHKHKACLLVPKG